MTSERMSPVDTAWLHMDKPGNPADIVTLLTFDDRLWRAMELAGLILASVATDEREAEEEAAK